MPALGLVSNGFPAYQTPRNAVERRQARFLACFATCGMIGRASRWAKISRYCHSEWLQSDPLYAARFAAASAEFDNLIRDTAHLVGVHRLEMSVLYKGRQIYLKGRPLFETKRSEAVLIRLLEARFKDEFNRRSEVINIEDLDPAKISPELMDKIINAMIARYTGNDPAVIAETRRQLEAAAIETTAEVGEPQRAKQA